MWFDGNGGDDEMDGGGGISVSPKVGKKRLKGKGGLGYEGVEVVEVDPVSFLRHLAGVADEPIRTS